MKGFTLVELLIVIALGLTLSIGIVSLFRIGLVSSTRTNRAIQAKNLVQEAMEGVVSVRNTGGANWDWTNTPALTTAEEYYQPTIVGTSWTLGSKLSTSPAPTLPAPNDPFTRTVQIESVQRGVGCNSSICPIVTVGGIVDPGTKKITVIVTWNDNGVRMASMSAYLTHWR